MAYRAEIVPLGLEGILVRFDDRLSDAGNGAALAFYRYLLDQAWAGIREVAPGLTSVAVFFDPLLVAPSDIRARLGDVLKMRDWSRAAAPQGQLWRVPVAFGGDAGPQLEEVAALVGLPCSEAISTLCSSPLRVLSLGFAPGQPYLGSLPAAWDIPRQTALTERVPVGAVVVAVRQAIIFATSAPTGWRQVGLSAFRPFQQEQPEPLRLSPGDRVQFTPVTADQLDTMRDLPDGGAEVVS